jgi:hypothetical protein
MRSCIGFLHQRTSFNNIFYAPTTNAIPDTLGTFTHLRGGANRHRRRIATTGSNTDKEGYWTCNCGNGPMKMANNLVCSECEHVLDVTECATTGHCEVTWM